MAARPPLRRSDLLDDPIRQFAEWFERAEAHPLIAHPEAACLSTLGPGGTPEGRMVLLKRFDARGFVFYTNLGSAKARALAAHPRAGLTLYWQPLGHQVRLRGPVAPTSEADADAYFATRSRASRIGAWASEQSREVAGRVALDRRASDFERQFEGVSVPRPPHWSGFRLEPEAVEFWKEGPARLHDRFLYLRVSGGEWALRRLYP